MRAESQWTSAVAYLKPLQADVVWDSVFCIFWKDDLCLRLISEDTLSRREQHSVIKHINIPAENRVHIPPSGMREDRKCSKDACKVCLYSNILARCMMGDHQCPDFYGKHQIEPSQNKRHAHMSAMSAHDLWVVEWLGEEATSSFSRPVIGHVTMVGERDSLGTKWPCEK